MCVDFLSFRRCSKFDETKIIALILWIFVMPRHKDPYSGKLLVLRQTTLELKFESQRQYDINTMMADMKDYI